MRYQDVHPTKLRRVERAPRPRAIEADRLSSICAPPDRQTHPVPQVVWAKECFIYLGALDRSARHECPTLLHRADYGLARAAKWIAPVEAAKVGLVRVATDTDRRTIEVAVDALSEFVKKVRPQTRRCGRVVD